MQAVAKEPIAFKNLLIIKQSTNIRAQARHPAIRSRFSEIQINAIRNSFENVFPAWVQQNTDGQVLLNNEVLVSEEELTDVYFAENSSAWISRGQLAQDLHRHAPPGKFDGAFFSVTLDDENGSSRAWALGSTEKFIVETREPALSISFATKLDSTAVNELGTEVFIHEWLHQLEAFYDPLGINLPRCNNGSLHCAEEFGYRQDPVHGWRRWYRDYLRADILNSERARVGIGEPGWSLGTFLVPKARVKDLR